MKIAIVQSDIAWEDKPANFVRITTLLRAARLAPGTLAVLPELFATGFTMNTEALAENPGEATEQFLSATAKELGIGILAGAAMRADVGRARNKALVFSPEGALTASYAKQRPFTLGGERDHYTAGGQSCVFDWQGVSVSPFVCYDLRFPELFRAAAAEHRPELFVVIANWPDKRIHHWTRLLQARAIENQAYVVGVNRVGRDPSHNYPGHSAVIDCHGEILASAGDQECVVTATLDLAALREYRRGLPFLNDLKPAG